MQGKEGTAVAGGAGQGNPINAQRSSFFVASSANRTAFFDAVILPETPRRLSGFVPTLVLATVMIAESAFSQPSSTSTPADVGSPPADTRGWGPLSFLMTDNEGRWWDLADTQIAERLGMHAEMENGQARRHLVYPHLRHRDTEFVVLGRKPKAIMMTSRMTGDRPEQIKIVFGNRGENLWAVYGEQHRKEALEYTELTRDMRQEIKNAIEEIDEDARYLTQQLTDLHGEPGSDRSRQRIDPNEKTKIWQIGETRVLLAHRKGRLTSLTLTHESRPSASAGEKSKAPASERRKEAASKVVREPNGDVYIEGIPEVHQGDKGYCSVASLERLLKFNFVQVDQYEIGSAAGSGVDRLGGGWNNVINIGRQITRRNRLTMGAVPASSRFRDFSKLIDRGIPLLCVHKSSPQLMTMLDEGSESRASLTPPTSRRQRELAARVSEALGQNPGAHSCLIVGYNKESEEIAVSNSWQDKSGNIWMPFEVFNAISLRADLVYLEPR